VLLDGSREPDRGPALSAGAYQSIVPLALPDLDGIPLTLTDLAVHPTLGLHFLAAAEATDDPYEDAPCAGSALGVSDAAFSRGCSRLRRTSRPRSRMVGAAGNWSLVDRR
jgi:hypothetical protein